jgi:hypothetical protein
VEFGFVLHVVEIEWLSGRENYYLFGEVPIRRIIQRICERHF